MPESYVGTANLAGANVPTLCVDGPCLTGTLANLKIPGAVEKIRADALDLLSRIVAAYEREIATGEVGANGTAKAGPSIPSKPCTGLLYGRIQSGKTVAMIALVAAAIDNGFRVVVVLTSDNLKLVAQTTDRFAVLDGPIAVDALTKGWESDYRHIGKKIGTAGVVFVCSKNKTRLDHLIGFLEEIGAPNHPALVLDDEADQATLDTNLAKSAKAVEKGDEPFDPTAIYDRVVRQLSPTLRHHVFLQVTATPYALLLQSVGTKLRPTFVRLLEPGAGYTGGDSFFEAEHLEGPKPPLVYVPDSESSEIQGGATDAPEGLRKAIAFFLVAAGAQALSDPERARSGQNFLCHTSQLRVQHRNLEQMVRDYVDRTDEHLERGSGEAFTRLQQAHDELRTTFPAVAPWEAVAQQISRRLIGRKVLVFNAETDAEAGKGMNFIVGGNIVGRGVTIENLLVTYYLRQPKTGQMDTMLQHARMYGYREQFMHLTRVFLPRVLAIRFHEIHVIETRLRRQLANADAGRPVVIQSAAGLKPTRSGVLDPTYIDAFDAGDHLYPQCPELAMKQKDYERIEQKIKALVGGDLGDEKLYYPIDYDVLLKLVAELPYDDTKGFSSWIPGVLVRLLERHRGRCNGQAYLHTRRTKRQQDYFPTGALHGDVLKRLRQLDGPVVCAFRDDGALIPGAKPFWYPSLVLDAKMESVVVNTTPDVDRP